MAKRSQIKRQNKKPPGVNFNSRPKLGPHQKAILKLLRESGDEGRKAIHKSEIAQTLNLTPKQVHGALKRLEGRKKVFVERELTSTVSDSKGNKIKTLKIPTKDIMPGRVRLVREDNPAMKTHAQQTYDYRMRMRRMSGGKYKG